MALTSTLFTGLSGLDVNQARLNVIGNNIANANTVAFKSSRALIKPQFYVTDSAGSPSDANNGGENPSQRGLGAVVATIQKDFSPGAIESTGKDTDMAIDGDGFFVVQGKEQAYTRDGSFSLNDSNQLVTSDGQFVQGFGVDSNGNVITGALQNVTVPIGSLTKAKATTTAAFQGNLNADGVTATGASDLVSTIGLADAAGGGPPVPMTTASLLTDLQDSKGATPFAINDVLTINGTKGGRDLAPLTFTVDGASTVQDLQDFYNQGLGIDTSVSTGGAAPGATFVPENPADPTDVFSDLSIVGNTGTDNALSLAGSGFTSTNPNMAVGFAEQGTPSGESVFTSYQVFDSLGTPLTVNITATLEAKTDAGTTWRFYASSPDDTDATKTFTEGQIPPSPGSIIGTGTLNFDQDGKLLSTTTPTIQINRTATGAQTPMTVSLDFSKMTALTDTSSTLLMSNQDGLSIGTLTSFSVGTNGIITGAFDNGLSSTLGQMAIATFDNPEGLQDQGSNLYTTGPDSGVPKITGPLELTAGAIRAGSLEDSNVDLSKEFTNMIVASTGFSAASRVISTADQLIQDLLNSTR